MTGFVCVGDQLDPRGQVEDQCDNQVGTLLPQAESPREGRACRYHIQGTK